MNGVQISRAVGFLMLSAIAIPARGAWAQGASSVLPLDTSSSAQPCKVPRTVADPEHMMRPKYPKESLKAGVEGSVELRALVDSNGKTRDLTVVKGESAFATPSADAVRKWHFHPALIEGKPVDTTYKVGVRFVLALQEAIPDWQIESPQEKPPLAGTMPTDLKTDTPDGPVYRVSAQQGVVGPKVTLQVDPEFSEKARKAGEQGTVVLTLIVGIDGKPRDIRVACGPTPDLSEKAIEAVKDWRFDPGTKDGKPVMVQIAVEVEFHLYKSP